MLPDKLQKGSKLVAKLLQSVLQAFVSRQTLRNELGLLILQALVFPHIVVIMDALDELFRYPIDAELT